jgi:hypothetical protein
VDVLLLDACVALNLIASQVSLAELGDAAGVRFVMTAVAAAETLYLAPEEPGGAVEMISLETLVAADMLHIAELMVEELASFVQFARIVDDGEASTLAAAIHRNLPVATDDRRGQRLAQELNVPVKTTAALMRAWATVGSAEPPAVTEALQAIRRRAHFFPARDDPDHAWWSLFDK